MRKKFLIGAMLVGMTAISACVQPSPQVSTTLAFSDDVSGINLNERLNLEKFRELYGKCLVVKSIQQSLESEANTYTPNSVKRVCAPLGRKYFEALYADAYQIEENSVFSQNTARTAVRNFETDAFNRIAAEHRRATQ